MTELLECRTTKLVIGVVNVTPDSFYDGGRHFDEDDAVEHALRLADEGADVLDVGGESTRPGSDPTREDVELRRAIPVIKRIAAATDVPISIDTRKSRVARAAIGCGATMVNDVSAFGDPGMLPLIAEACVACVAMHMQGEPKTMQDDPRYDDVVSEVYEFLAGRVRLAEAAGVDPSRVLVDPGIGFGKTDAHNLALIKATPRFAGLGAGVMIGASRKGMVGRLLNLPLEQRLEGSLAVAAYAMLNGAAAVRVHDVAATVRVRTILSAIEKVA